MLEYIKSIDTTSLVSTIVSGIFGLSIFIEIVPIKINPWSKFFKWVGRKINGDLYDRVDEISKEIKKVSDRNDEDEMDRIRHEILSFATSCRNGNRHTKEEFDHIISLNDKYENLLEKSGVVNGVYEEQYKYIKEVYSNCLKKNSFL